MPRALRILTCLTIANALLLILPYLVERFVAERHWLTTLITFAPQHPFGVPTLILLLWSALRLRWRLVGVNALAGVFFAFALLGLNVPWRSIRAPSGMPLRVMTYNIHHAMMGVVEVAGAIRAQSPDVVCLQEVCASRQWPDPLGALSAAMPGYRVVRAGDVAVFSRFPIEAQSVRLLSSGAERVVLSAVLRVRGRRVTILTAHLNVSFGETLPIRHPRRLPSYVDSCGSIRRMQAATLRRLCDPTRGPVILTGDLNTPPRGLTYRSLTGRLRDAFVLAGWGSGCTFRSDLPVLRIDYIFVRPGVGVRRCFVPATRASDHRPVVADIVLP